MRRCTTRSHARIYTADVEPTEESELADEEPATEALLRRSSTQWRASSRYLPDEYVMIIDGGEPKPYQEAMINVHRDEWLKAMQEEMRSLHEKPHK